MSSCIINNDQKKSDHKKTPSTKLQNGKFDNNKFQSLIAGYQVNRLLSHDEKQSMPVMLRGAAIRILITRLYDQLYHPAGAFVIPKDPLEYFSILQFHQTHNFFEVNI